MTFKEIKIRTLGELVLTLDHIHQEYWKLKTINDIWTEIQEGECKLIDIDGIVTRCVDVGFCNIQRPDGKFLVEISQTWPDGSVKYRNCPVAGKLKSGEVPEFGMMREIIEELGITGHDSFDIKFEKIVTKSGDSPYYPGLAALWQEHWFSWQMPQHLVQDNYVEDDGKKVTIFGWVDEMPIMSM